MSENEKTIFSSPAESLSLIENDTDEYSKSLQGKIEQKQQKLDFDSDDDDDLDSDDDHPTSTDLHDNSTRINAGFCVGFSEDRNKRYRRSMEDSHSFFYNFGNVPGQGWFAIFDGHAGKSTAEYCGENLHENFKNTLIEFPDIPIPEILNKTFIKTDTQLGEKKGLFSGATAIVAFVRKETKKYNENDQLESTKRVLYTANVGDSRAVLNRNGIAVRLSYDHKGSDHNEVRRIVEAGGFVMNNRVNGVLAVTRALGDIAMKEWVVGSPFTTETVLDDNDTHLILACDGLWDVCTDQAAIDLIKDLKDPQIASNILLEHAMNKMSTDNLSILTVNFDQLQ